MGFDIRSGSLSGITESNPPLGISNVEYRSLESSKKFILKVSTTMLIEHFLCDDVGGKPNVCEMEFSFYN